VDVALGIGGSRRFGDGVFGAEVLVEAGGGGHDGTILSPDRCGRAMAHSLITQLRVLVVDDIESNRRLAQAMLRRFGHVSEVATSAPGAVVVTVSGRYD